MAEKIIDKVHGKYGVYEIVKKTGIISDDYYVKKNGDYWKSASNPKDAYEKIKKEDPGVS